MTGVKCFYSKAVLNKDRNWCQLPKHHCIKTNNQHNKTKHQICFSLIETLGFSTRCIHSKRKVGMYALGVFTDRLVRLFFSAANLTNEMYIQLLEDVVNPAFIEIIIIKNMTGDHFIYSRAVLLSTKHCEFVSI